MRRYTAAVTASVLVCLGIPGVSMAEELHLTGKLTFSRFVGGDSEIFVMNADGTGLRQVTDNKSDDFEPSWSPDGKRIVYVRDWRRRKPRGPRLMLVSAVGGKPEVFYRYCDDLYEPEWSPDGEWIAFESDVGEDGSDLIAHSVTGHRRRFISAADENSSEGNVEWSPDGNSVAWVSYYDYGDIFIASFPRDEDWSESHLAATDAYDMPPLAWSPDGSTMLYSDDYWETALDVSLEDESGWDIYSIPVAGGDPVIVVGGPGQQMVGDWSGDGSMFVYRSNEDGAPDLYMASADGQTRWKVIELDGKEGLPDWWTPPT
jgi:TolB protein